MPFDISDLAMEGFVRIASLVFLIPCPSSDECVVATGYELEERRHSASMVETHKSESDYLAQLRASTKSPT